MELTSEQVEKVARFSGVSMEAARRALEQADGSPLDAVLLLERQGRAPSVPGGTWSTRFGAPVEGPVAKQPAVRQRPRRGYSAKEVGDVIKDFLRTCTKVSVDIWRGDDLVVGIPLIVCVLLFVAAFRIMLPLALVGLILRCRYHISGWQGSTADINRTMDRVSDTVAGWTEKAREAWRRHRGERKKK